MTPQERTLIADLFDRLAGLESQPRDPQAERAIGEGLSRAPHAVYYLVQTVLVQDEALKVANARMEEIGGTGEAERPSSFLDSMRSAVFGRGEERRGSVPSVPAGSPGYEGPGPQESVPPQAPSFLGQAAATAAGMVGGSLLLNGIRSMFGGHHEHGPFAAAFDHLHAGSGQTGSDTLAKKAGLDDIGRVRAHDKDETKDEDENDDDDGDEGDDDDGDSDDEESDEDDDDDDDDGDDDDDVEDV